MSSSRLISMPRALFILARLSLRRQLNQWQNVRFARKRRSFLQPATIATPSGSGSSADTVKRFATPTKSRGPSIFGIFLFLMLGFNGFFLGERGLVLLSSTAQSLNDTNGNRIEVTRSTETQLKKADAALRRVRQLRDPAEREKYLGM
jgi:hypothetical protein